MVRLQSLSFPSTRLIVLLSKDPQLHTTKMFLISRGVLFENGKEEIIHSRAYHHLCFRLQSKLQIFRFL